MLRTDKITGKDFTMTRRKLASLLLAGTVSPLLLRSQPASAGAPIEATLYKNPSCSCCEKYAQYLDQNGSQVDVKPTNDLADIS